jgi:hypothetical protein
MTEIDDKLILVSVVTVLYTLISIATFVLLLDPLL